MASSSIGCRGQEPVSGESDKVVADAGRAEVTPPAPATGPPGPVPSDLGDENVVPLFPPGQFTPHPDAQRACAVIHEVPATARAACCEGAEVAYPIDECVRTLSLAMADGALSVDGAALGRCEAAMRKKVAGCDWVTPLTTVVVPECSGVFRGTRPSGGRCRSSLECAAGLHCDGLGPTQPGVCTAPKVDGSECHPVTDLLAGLTGQDDAVATAHATCDGYCHARRCVARVPLGGACDYVAACGSEARCTGRVCVAGRFAALGETCGVGSPCASGASCQSGVCVALKKKGEACAGPFECEASCVVAAGAKAGTCGPRCSASR